MPCARSSQLNNPCIALAVSRWATVGPPQLLQTHRMDPAVALPRADRPAKMLGTGKATGGRQGWRWVEPRQALWQLLTRSDISGPVGLMRLPIAGRCATGGWNCGRNCGWSCGWSCGWNCGWNCNQNQGWTSSPVLMAGAGVSGVIGGSSVGAGCGSGSGQGRRCGGRIPQGLECGGVALGHLPALPPPSIFGTSPLRLVQLSPWVLGAAWARTCFGAAWVGPMIFLRRRLRASSVINMDRHVACASRPHWPRAG
jgi:hypothetical protein